MMKLLTFKRPDGGISLFSVNRPGMGEKEALDAEETSLRMKSRTPNGDMVAMVPDDWIRVADTDPADLPADRTFRNAWTHDGKISVDMTKAQEVVREHLRAAREPKLAALDVEFLRAAETQDAAKLNAITAKKQALRDITADPSITNAKTVKGLTSALTKLKQSIEA